MVFSDTSLSSSKTTVIYTESSSVTSFNNKKFMKTIHLKEEIGIFVFYTDKDDIPLISLYKCNSNNILEIYNSFRNIKIDKISFNNDNILNDLVKLNDSQICFVSTSSDKLSLYVVIFSLYNNDLKMNIRYYSIEMWNDSKQIIFKDIKVSLYKNFLSISYSHCPQ